jgi:hypothetical protein
MACVLLGFSPPSPRGDAYFALAMEWQAGDHMKLGA